MAGDYEVEFVERGDREARFLVRGITPAFANGIRRAMIADVPTFSVDTVRVIENSSVMFDEQIAHRLGLVPLTTPEPGEFELGETVTLSLDVQGPDTAYSGDIVSSDAMVESADGNVPIIDLKEGQRLEVEADAVLGVGRDHAKHQGGVAVGYRHLQRVEVVGDKSDFDDDNPEILRGVIEEAAAEHAEPVDGDEPNDGDLVATAEFDNDLSTRYPGKEVEVVDVDNAFVFHVETDGSFSADELVVQAIGTIEDRAADLREAVQL
jgi:DNA-directed RNA polymerase subunit D